MKQRMALQLSEPLMYASEDHASPRAEWVNIPSEKMEPASTCSTRRTTQNWTKTSTPKKLSYDENQGYKNDGREINIINSRIEQSVTKKMALFWKNASYVGNLQLLSHSSSQDTCVLCSVAARLDSVFRYSWDKSRRGLEKVWLSPVQKLCWMKAHDILLPKIFEMLESKAFVSSHSFSVSFQSMKPSS